MEKITGPDLMEAKAKFAQQHPPRYFETSAGASRADQPQVIQDFGTYWRHPLDWTNAA